MCVLLFLFQVTYDYRYIDPGPDDISFDKNNGRYFALEVINYTLSHLENDRDVSAYSGGRRLSSRAQLVCILTRVSLGALSDITVVLGMRQSIEWYYTSQNIFFASEIFYMLFVIGLKFQSGMNKIFLELSFSI